MGPSGYASTVSLWCAGVVLLSERIAVPLREFCNPLMLGEYWYWPSTHRSGVMSVSSTLSSGAA